MLRVHVYIICGGGGVEIFPLRKRRGWDAGGGASSTYSKNLRWVSSVGVFFYVSPGTCRLSCMTVGQCFDFVSAFPMRVVHLPVV